MTGPPPRVPTRPDERPSGEGLRERKKRATRRALQSAALSLVEERGLESVTVHEIAAAAQVSPRTFFNYFGTKEDALVGTDPAGPGRLADQLLARPGGEQPLTALRAVYLAQAGTIAEDQPLWRLRQRVVRANPSLWPALVGASTETERRLAEAVRQRTGRAPDDPYPALVAATAAATMRTCLQHVAATGFREPLTEVVAAAFDALSAGLPSS